MNLKLVLTLVLIYSATLSAQWVQTNGPKEGIGVKQLVVYDNIIYAASGNGVFVSTDSGTSWNYRSRGLEYQSKFNAITSNGSKVFVASSTIFASTDNGMNWYRSSEGIWDGQINALAVNSNYIYAGSDDHGLFVSSNNGVTWTKSSNNGIKKDEWGRIPITALSIKDNYIFAGTWFSDGLYVTTDNGENWTLLNNGLTGKNISCILINGQNIFVGTDDQGIFLSQNNGASWQQINNGLPTIPFHGTPQIVTIGNNGNIVFVSVISSEGQLIYSSSNNGISWEKHSTGIQYSITSSVASSFALSNDGFYAGGQTGIYKLSDDGNSWYSINERFPPLTSIYDLIIDNNNIFALSNKIFKSSNAGGQWESLVSPRLNGDINSIGKIDNNIFVNSQGLFTTTDYGAHWTDLNRWSLRLFISQGKIYSVTGYHTIYISTDLGKTWNTINPETDFYNDVVSSVETSGDNIYLGIEYKGLMFSTNNGTTWIKDPTGFPNNVYVTKILVKENLIFATTLNKGVYLSNDGGFTWYEANSGIENNLSVTTIKFIDNRLFVVCAENNYSGRRKVFASNNNGYSWTNVSEGFTSENVYCLCADQTYIYAGTIGSGVWRRPLYEIITNIEQQEIPATYSLSQNYPNPFNPNTTIRYSIPVETRHASSLQHVTLKVYDLLGRDVVTLVKEEKFPGEYEVKFNGNNFSSGVYFYRLQAGSFNQTKKFVLMK